MSVFSTSMNHHSFYSRISLVCFVLGLLLAASVFTTTRNANAGIPPRVGFTAGLPSYDMEKQYQATEKQYQAEIKKQRSRNTELEQIIADRRGEADAALNKELQETKSFAGLTEVVGPGVQVTLTDSNRQMPAPSSQSQLNSLIHDSDIANVVNELRATGAEAIAVNGQRVIGYTAIRCVGPVVHVNGLPSAPPYIIQAIGDPKTLESGMNLQWGVLDGLRQYDPNMVRIEAKAKLRLPAYAGVTQLHFVHTVDASGSDTSKEHK